MLPRRGAILIIASLCFVSLVVAEVDSKSKSSNNEEQAEEPVVEFVILNTEKDRVKEHQESPQESVRQQEIMDNDIDRMPHVRQSTEKPALDITYRKHPFDEYTYEVEDERLNREDKAKLTTAIGILANRRTAEHSDGDIRSAYRDLEDFANVGNMEAQKILAFAYLFGDHHWSIGEAKQLFQGLAERGSTDGHLGMALFYLTGLTMRRPDRARGLTHLNFAAIGGNPLAQMAMGYRYLGGVDVKPSCQNALMWYRRVAKVVASKVTFLGGSSVQRLRIPEELESASSNMMDPNVFTYYKYLAENGDVPAILGLATLFLTGSKGVPIDHYEATAYFKRAADAGNAQALAYLGKMYYDGTAATPRNDAEAFRYFKKAADKGNSLGQTGLGLMYLDGRGIRTDYTRALRMFTSAAEQNSVEGQFYLGYMHYRGFGGVRDHKIAAKYFQLASQSGNLLAIYNLAVMQASGVGVTQSCPLAVELFKTVAERGRWTERFMDSYRKYQAGATDEAAFNYMILGELGYEIAQTNFAHLIEENAKKQDLFHTELEAYKWALLSWQRSANQQYPFARVKLGDFNFYGLGTAIDYAAALNHYKIAADNHQNAQAMFNLAYMHEQGLGLDRDLHLAKRYYDSAAETSVDAIVPVALAMLKLRVIFFFDYMKENLAWHSALILFLDSTLGPHWDFFVMSLLLTVIPYLFFQYLINRPRQHQRAVPNVEVPPPAPAPAQ